MFIKTFQSFAYSASLAAFTLCAVLPTPASALPTFQPAGSWAVGQAQLPDMRGLEGMNLPCVLSNEYDNGFTVRFSGGGKQIMAMAIDFRQNIFRPGRKYTAMLSLGDTYSKQVSASAFTANTLIFNLRGLEDFYKIAAKAPEMELNIAENIMTFSLSGLNAAYPSLEQCYSGEEAVPVPAPARDAVPFAAPVAPPQTMNEIMQADGAPMPITREIPARSSASIPQWNASAGEEIQTVLNRWADRAGYDLQWQAGTSGKVAQNVALDGTFEQAVSQLLAENGAANGLQSRIDQPVPSAPAPGMNWNAPAGASMKTVLEQWGKQAGVAVVWKAPLNPPIKQAVTMSGPFEAAVQVLLDQYMNDSARPVGELKDDSSSGTRTLTIDVDRAG